ncbi:MAG: hypothetical protein QXR12_06545 [Thermofilum sp.]
MREVGEEEIKLLLELLAPPIIDEVSKILSKLEERQDRLEQRLDSFARELEAVKSSVKDTALATASEFARQAVEAAIEAARRSTTGQISVATEPVIARLNELEKRMERVERLLESSAQGIAGAIDVGVKEMRRVSEEGLKALREEVKRVSSVPETLEVLRKGIENLTRVVSQQRREVQAQLPPDVIQKIDAILTAVTALRERLSLAGGGRGGAEEGEEEV